MKHFDSSNIKNVALVGHGSAGKTTLAEAMLYLAKATDRLGKVADGNTVMDFDHEEKKRKFSINSAIASIDYKDTKINIIDTPGLFDFASGINEGLRAAQTAIIVLSAKSGIEVGAEKMFKSATKAGLKKMFFITEADGENTDCIKVFNQLKDTYGPSVCPVVIPHVVNNAVESYVNLVTGEAFKYNNGTATKVDRPDMNGYFDEIYGTLCETVAGVDEELMEKFFDEKPFTAEELYNGLKKGVASGDIIPVYCGSGLNCDAVDLMMDGMVKFLPSAATAEPEKAKNDKDEELELKCDENGPLAAIIFKTVSDPFVGKLSYFKVISGKIKPNSTVINSRTGETEKVNKVLLVKGGKQEDTDFVAAGDIGAIAKLGNVATGDTLSDSSNVLTLIGVNYPLPSNSMAISPVKKGDEDKIAQALVRIMEEDPAIVYENNTETKQQVISGLGEQHLDVIVAKLKSKFGVEVVLSPTRVAYRETIRKKVKVQGRHKKQSGGHGQFGDVWIVFEPCDSDKLLFKEKIFGGSVPKNYFPAVEKGLQDSVKHGVLAGYPVVGLMATLVDGSYHPVDSSEMSFKMAAALAYKNGLAQASPALLEPIGTLKANVPDDNMGDIIGDINKRRGRVLGMNPLEDRYQEIVAEVPMAEMSDFSTVLRSVSQGRGSFTFTFERYEEAPEMIAKKVIEEEKLRKEA